MYDNNINEIHKFPSFVFGEINSHQTWGVQMGTIRGYSVHKPRNISRDYPPTHCWLKCPFQGKQAAPPLQPLKRWKTQTLGALETTLDNIRNRDHSVHTIYLSLSHSLSLSFICLAVYLSICLSIYLSTCLSVVQCH